MGLWKWLSKMFKDKYAFPVGTKVMHKISGYVGYVIGHSFADDVNYTQVRFLGTKGKLFVRNVVEDEIVAWSVVDAELIKRENFACECLVKVMKDMIKEAKAIKK